MQSQEVCVKVNPGICGLPCIFLVHKIDKYKAHIKIIEAKCAKVRKMTEEIKEIGVRDLFASITSNPVYLAAQKAGCHASCIVPVAILKATEVAMEMALPQSATIELIDGHN